MQFLRFSAAVVCLALAAVTAPAQAGSSDAIIAGAAGFAVGTIFGNATAGPRYYPGPVYVAPPPPPIVYRPAPVVYYGAYGAAPWSPEWYASCARRYRSFDPHSGTYMGHDGYRHMCR